MRDLIIQAPHLAMKNKDAVKTSDKCGCYHCLAIFPSEKVSDWTDNNQTALCPNCSVDSVVPNFTDLDCLSKAQTYWF